LLTVVAAVCLAVSAVILPWIRWGFSYPGFGNIGTAVSLWDIATTGTARDFGVPWIMGVAAGMAAALVGSLLELIQRPVNRVPRFMALAGFGLAVGSCCIGLVVGVSGFGNSTSAVPNDTFSSSLDLGFWLGLGIAVVGAIASLLRLEEPPNPARQPVPFAPSPWGPPPGILPAGYYPPATDWSEYLSRGQVPPGFVPPSYQPAVYPTPGYVTPAWTVPGHPAPAFGPPLGSDPGAAGASSSAADRPEGPGPGHLVVVEAGNSKWLTVEPGKRLLVGRDPDADIRLKDPKVSERHATIERRTDEWAVQDVDAVNPTRLIDAWGTNRQVRGETTITSGQLIVGEVQITLYANQS
jgi:hypothetical protein